ncbi:hypothetical protein IFM89_008504 [Coptis chinensis]|uniref:Alcohol dehydrogenase-like N-terminal domain-containing protein n=1 Tax=Coptis chinensis TaxID=261450 RepID=A0A835HD49_9MAGN|nr:hypothetical protein IFM89_008504 [Coptis chinensis]
MDCLSDIQSNANGNLCPGETRGKVITCKGHEAAGIVESVGEGILHIKEGDHVVPIFNGECGDCAYCKSEKTNLCAKFRVNPMKSIMVVDGKASWLWIQNFFSGWAGVDRTSDNAIYQVINH